MNELTKLLYRKEMCENTMKTLSSGLKIYSEYADSLKEKLSDKKTGKRQKISLRKELYEIEWTARSYAVSFRETKREYEHYLIPKIESIATDEEKLVISFVDCEKQAKELAKVELYGKSTKQPDNIEHVEIISAYKKQLENIDTLIHELQNEIKEYSGLKKARANKELYELQLHAIALNKRLDERIDYYTNEFKPKFELELEDAKNNLESYLSKAKDYAKSGIDPKLYFMLQEYEKHKNEDEMLWLFYTALKKRVDEIEHTMVQEQLNKNSNLKKV